MVITYTRICPIFRFATQILNGGKKINDKNEYRYKMNVTYSK